MQAAGGDTPRGPVRRIVAAAGGVGALLAVVGIASAARGGSSAGTAGRAHPLVVRVVVDLVVGLAAAMALLAVMVLIDALIASRRHPLRTRRAPPGRRGTWWERMLAGIASLVVLVAAGLLIGRFGLGLDPRAGREEGALFDGPGSGDGSGGAAEPDALAVVAIMVTAVGGVLALLVVEQRRHRSAAAPAPLDPGPGPTPVLPGLDALTAAGLEELEREPDPRRAVVRAYRAMVAVLASWGWPRRPSDAPFELLDRALVGLGAATAPARRLTLLFERAEFSDHPVTDAAKAEAIAALRRLGRERAA